MVATYNNYLQKQYGFTQTSYLHEIPVSATPNAIGALNGPFAKFNHQFSHLASGDVQQGLSLLWSPLIG